MSLLTYDELLDQLSGYQVTVRPGENKISIREGNSLPADVRVHLRLNPDLRKAAIWYVCAVASGEIRELEEYECQEYQAIIPFREEPDEEEGTMPCEILNAKPAEMSKPMAETAFAPSAEKL